MAGAPGGMAIVCVLATIVGAAVVAYLSRGCHACACKWLLLVLGGRGVRGGGGVGWGAGRACDMLGVSTSASVVVINVEC